MEIKNVKVNDIAESIVACGYIDARDIDEYINGDENIFETAKNEISLGWDYFLKGINVSLDITCTIKLLLILLQYTDIEIVGTQDIDCAILNPKIKFNKYIDKEIVERLKELRRLYQSDKSLDNLWKLAYSTPCGIEITARVATNYRVLKDIRKGKWLNHFDTENNEFIKWIDTLPKAKDLILGGTNEK